VTKFPDNARIVEYAKVELKDPVLIQGLPGLGFVGKVSVDYLVEKLRPTKIAELYSSYLTLPDGSLGINVEMNGSFSLPKYEFYAYADTTPNLVLLTGNAQPNPLGQYEVAEAVLDYAISLQCKTVIAVGGYGVRVPHEVGTVYAITSDSALAEKLTKEGAQMSKGGVIVGACGVVLGVCAQKNMQCVGLLGATRGMHPDIQAARAVVHLIAKTYNLQIELKELDQEAADIKAKIDQLSRIQAEFARKRPEEKKREDRYII
jgi:uncharacterized protein (TIGR00162 family)